jgi:hypothetical protein
MKTNPEIAILLVGGTANFNGFSISPSPKALLPIANRPLYYYLEKALAAVEVKKIIFCVKPEIGELVRARLSAHFQEMEYLVRETSLGSAGTLREIQSSLNGGPFWRSALRTFADNPFLLIKTTLQGMLRFLFDPGGAKYLKLFQGESDQIQFYAYVVNHGYLKTILVLFKEKPLMFWANLVPAVLLLGYYLLAVIGLFRNPPDRAALGALIGVALYFLVISAGPADGPRFRLTIVPIICLLAGPGWVWLCRRLHSQG